MRKHRRVAIAYPKAPAGTCRFCGRPCPGDGRSHPACETRYRESRHHRDAMLERRGGPQKVVCVDRGKSPCHGKIQSDHVRELIDNGDPAWTVPRCSKHHKEKTQAAAAARRARQGRRKMSGSNDTPGGGMDDSEFLPIMGFLGMLFGYLGSIGFFDLSNWVEWIKERVPEGAAASVADKVPSPSMPTIPWGWIIVAAAVFTAVTVLRSRRRRALARLTEALARATYTDPSEIRVKVGLLSSATGRCHYSSAFNDGPGSADRAGVEDVIARKVGTHVGVKWLPHQDTVKWSRRYAAAPDNDETLLEAPPDTHPGRTVVERLQDALANQVPRGEGLEVIAVESDRKGPTVIEVHYPASVRDDVPDTRASWQDIVATKSPEFRWKPEWDTAANILTLTRRPPIPERVERAEPVDTDEQYVIPLAVDEHGDPVAWNMKVTPHALFAGETGSGKTVALSRVIIEAAARGFDLVLVDGKGVALAGFRNWPGVVKYGMADGRAMAEALEWAEDEMRRRYERVINDGAKPSDFRPLLVVVDEFTEVLQLMRRWWTREGALENGTENDRGKIIKSPLKEPRACESWSSIGRLGREGRVHIVVGIQQAAASIFGSTESRDQLGFRVVCGATTRQSATMMFGRSDIGGDVPERAKGRGTIQPRRGGDGLEVQVYWTPAPQPHGEMPDDPQDAALLRRYRDAVKQPVTVGSAAAVVAEDTDPQWAAVPVVEDEPVYSPPRRAAAKSRLPGSRWSGRPVDSLNDGDVIRDGGVVARVAEVRVEDEDVEVDVTVIGGSDDGAEQVWTFGDGHVVEKRV